jgi:adenylate cyclase
VYTFMFADICGYTEYTWRHGDERSAELALAFHRRVGELAELEQCDLIKSIGDGVMVRALDCDSAVRLARRIQSEPGFPAIRIGLDTGPAVARGGDWWGTTVNTAARMVDAAGAGEVLMTERAHAAACGTDAVDRGRQAFKGLPDCRVYAAATV